MSLEESSTFQANRIKVILVGNQSVGKTNLINILIGKAFDSHTLATLAQNYSIKTIEYNGINYILEIWDTIGQEKLRTINKLFYKNSKIVIFVYDITSLQSFQDLKIWVQEIDTQIGLNNIIKGVVGNKKDLYFDEQVNETEGKAFAESIGADFLHTSAKSDPGGIFLDFIIKLMKKYINLNLNNKTNNNGITLNYATTFKKRKKESCCK